MQREAEEEVTEGSDVTEVSWKDKLLTALLAMPPDAFERLCQRILRKSGFTKVEVTGRSGDGGIDGTGVLRVNLLSFHVPNRFGWCPGCSGFPWSDGWAGRQGAG